MSNRNWTPFGLAKLLLPVILLGCQAGDRTEDLQVLAEACQERQEAHVVGQAHAAPSGQERALLLDPEHPDLNRTAPDRFHVCLLTTQGPMLLESVREWAPIGVDRFYNLARAGYFDDTRFFRVVEDRWAQFGIHGDPEVATTWRDRTMPDDPPGISNAEGTIAFAFAVPNGRTTQLFINLRDNRATLDPEPFVPVARIVVGMEVAGSLYAGYGESAGGGIRAGNQEPLFEGGNEYLDERFPQLDGVLGAVIVDP